MKFYIATALENAAQAGEVAALLKAAGHEQTYDWTAHGSVEERGYPAKQIAAADETGGVRSADVVIVLLPGRRGTNVELGMALAFGKRVFLWGRSAEAYYQDGRECAFYCTAGIGRLVGPLKESIEHILEILDGRWGT